MGRVDRSPAREDGPPEERVECTVATMRRMRGVRRRRRFDCQGLRELLAIAGANVAVQAIARWSHRERAEAIAWAHAQIDAFKHDKPGYQTSVFWPEHISRSNREWPTRQAC